MTKDSLCLGGDRFVRSEQRGPPECLADEVCLGFLNPGSTEEDGIWVGEDELVDFLAELRDKFLEYEVGCLFESDCFFAFAWPARDLELLPCKCCSIGDVVMVSVLTSTSERGC